MNEKRYIQETIDQGEKYLKGDISKEAVSEWALGIIKLEEWEDFSEELQEAIHILFDLHDSSEPWCPDNDEVKRSIYKLKVRN